MRFLSTGALTLLLLALSTPAPGQTRRKIEVTKKDPTGRGVLDGFRTKAPRAPPAKQVLVRKAKEQTVVGTLVSGSSGDVLLERSVDARTAAALQRMRFRVIQSKEQIADRTILGDKVYVLYDVKSPTPIGSEAKKLEGSRVELRVRMDSDGTPLVIGIRAK